MDESVQRRAERGQAQAGRPRTGRLAPNYLASDQCHCNRHLQKIRAVSKEGSETWMATLGRPA